MTRPRRAAPLPPIRLRLTILLAVMTLAFLGIGARLVELQARDRTHLSSLGVGQRVQTVALPAERGSIFDRNGVDLALSVPQTTIVADPHVMHHPATDAAKLARVVVVDEAELEAKLSQPHSRFAYVARKVDDATVRAREGVTSQRPLLHPGVEALLPVGPARRTRARLRRHRQLRTRRPRVVLRGELERPLG